ncbi:protein yellow-like [Ruditapes philippinarum]|uniref:protein yellow-like n=1 Tax=Ruditapes philippinarum TaxID=129788 RepID=UPI00295BB829|nr:protein yellow-like [Ruditapes philippinarum]XP_060581098.1 protein yellow-like [Ruditapes philippinarum]
MKLALLFMLGVFCGASADDHKNGGKSPDIVYQWNIVEYEWPNDTYKQQQINNTNYIPKNSAINGIKLYNGTVYVTVPRLKPGVPSTLNVIIDAPEGSNGSSHLLRPFPNWDMQELGNCAALQRVQSMEIDPNTGYMWIVDTGYIAKMQDVGVQPVDSCPAKIIIFDLNKHEEVHRYIFPRLTVGYGLFYLNDIVLGYSENVARYAFMSDTLDYKLVVYDYKEDISYAYSHSNMRADEKYINITISNMTLTGIITGINGIAMSPDFKYVYYSSVAGVGLHQIETSVLTSARGNSAAFAAAVRTIGEKVSPGDGMTYGSNDKLYYSALGPNAIYEWDISKDLGSSLDFNTVPLISQSELVSDPRMQWVDTLALDDNGFLWYTTSRLNKFFSSDGIVHHEPNFFIWKIYVGDEHYLSVKQDIPILAGQSNVASIFITTFCVVSAFVLLL